MKTKTKLSSLISIRMGYIAKRCISRFSRSWTSSRHVGSAVGGCQMLIRWFASNQVTRKTIESLDLLTGMQDWKLVS